MKRAASWAGAWRRLALCALASIGSACGVTTLAAHERVLPAIELQGAWHRAAAAEDLAALAERHGVPLIDLEEINGLDRSAPPPAGRLLFVPRAEPRRKTPVRRATPTSLPTSRPARGRLGWPLALAAPVVSRFGRRGVQAHEGVDLAAAEGTPVLAAEAGKVIYAGSGIRGYGNLIILRHDGDLITVYAHNRRNLVERGASVQRGARIAEVGHTGRASGNHLHFEVRHGETAVDPLPYLGAPPPAR